MARPAVGDEAIARARRRRCDRAKDRFHQLAIDARELFRRYHEMIAFVWRQIADRSGRRLA
eukprot:6202987-Pleurochrysis_carterae.AAC.4